MHSCRAFSIAATVLAAAILMACTDSADAPLAPDPLPPLPTQTWYAHVADGQSLPALVGHGVVEGVLEQTFLDSVELHVTTEGRWEQRSWLQRFRAGQLVTQFARLDAGAWAVTDTGYLF